MSTTIYDFLGVESDPLYQQLRQVDENNEIVVEGFIVRKDKFIEVSNDEMHECFKNLESCYQFLIEVTR